MLRDGLLIGGNGNARDVVSGKKVMQQSLFDKTGHPFLQHLLTHRDATRLKVTVDDRDVDAVSFTAEPGRIFGLLGPNGAGKTSAIRMIAYITTPDAGHITLGGRPVGPATQRRMGYLPEERGLYRKLKVGEQLIYLGQLKGMKGSAAEAAARRWLDRFGAASWWTRKVEELSKGMQQKVQFAVTVLHEPEVLVLDEPFSGLDPINQRVLREIIGELKRAGRTILFSTHIIEHAERMCDHVCIIARGRKLVDGPVARVKAEHGERYVSVATADGGDARAAIEASPAVATVRDPSGPGESNRGVYQVVLRPGSGPDALLQDLVQRRVSLRKFELVEPTLEQVFIERVGEAPAHAHTAVESEVAHV